MLKTTSAAFIEIASFLTFKAKLVFPQLKQAFTEALILCYFDPEYYI